MQRRDIERRNDIYDDAFLNAMEKSLRPSKTKISDEEWEERNKQWDDEHSKLVHHMMNNTIWSTKIKKSGAGVTTKATPSAIMMITPISSTSPASGRGASKPKNMTFSSWKKKLIRKSKIGGDTTKVLWKVPKLSQLELFKYLEKWDKASYAKRDRMIMDFVRIYDTKEKVYDTDSTFSYGGSLMFCRFTVGLHICFLRHRKVGHYYDALGIFVRSLQSGKYAEEFLRLGGLSYIVQVFTKPDSPESERMSSIRFLLDLVRSRKGHCVKMFLCEKPQLFELLLDSLKSTQNEDIINCVCCIFEHLCYEIPPETIATVINFAAHAVRCDLHPVLNVTGMRVIQRLVHLRPHLAQSLKPMLDSLDCKGVIMQMMNVNSIEALLNAFGSSTEPSSTVD